MLLSSFQSGSKIASRCSCLRANSRGSPTSIQVSQIGIMILLVTTMANMPRQALSAISRMMSIGIRPMSAKPTTPVRIAMVP